MAAAFFHGVTAARAAEAAEQREAAAVEAGGGPRQRWDCVAFVADGDIYIINLDGTGLTRLTADDAADSLPVFSPDGTKIAFDSVRDGDGAVNVVNADGSDPRRLSPPNDALGGYYAYVDYWPVFSPDGEWVAATRCYKPECEIIFFPAGGGPEEYFSTKIRDPWGRERPTNYEGPFPWGDIRNPKFSADGRRVAFYVATGDCSRALWTANVDGSDANPLIGENIVSYTLSPDWEKVVYQIDTVEGTECFVINADGTGRRKLTGGDTYGFWPAFSPDGKEIIYAYGGVIYAMNADGTKRPLTSGGRYNENPVFSPDGKKIIYSSNVRRGLDTVSDIYIMNADGSEGRALTRTPEDERAARFTPDGSKIVFSALPPAENDDGEPGFYVMNADGSGRRFLATGYYYSLGPSLVEGRLLDSYGNWHAVLGEPETSPRSE
jgi:Tol biopolymer transport system component